MYTAQQYLRQLIKLQPPGLAWPTESTKTWIKLLSALAQAYARVDARVDALMREARVDTTNEMLTDWETEFGLPDECSTLGDTVAIRRANLKAKYLGTGGQSRQYFIDLAASLGYTVTIDEFRPTRVSQARAGDHLYSVTWAHAFRINAPMVTTFNFITGTSVAGDPLSTFGNARLECVIRKNAKASKIVLFRYGA